MGLLSATLELVDDLIADVTRIGRHVWQSPIPYLGFGFGAAIVTWLLLGRTENGDFLSVAFWSENPEGMRNLLWSLATIAAGAAGLYALSLAALRTRALSDQTQIAEENRQLLEQAQITERFTRAVEQLGHEKRAVRLGAIYALERIAKDSARDSETIIETLAAYVRDQAPWPPKEDARSKDTKSVQKHMRPSIDVAAVTTVLFRIVPEFSEHREQVFGFDLRYTDLGGLDLRWKNLSGFNFENSRLDSAELIGANLRGAELHQAVMKGVNLDGADLHGARMIDADASGAEMGGAVLSKVMFNRANLERVGFDGSDVSGANFEGARNMSSGQLCYTYFELGDPPVNLPEGVAMPTFNSSAEAFGGSKERTAQGDLFLSLS